MLSKDSYHLLKIFNRKKSLSDDEVKKYNISAFNLLLEEGYIVSKFLGYRENMYAEYSDYFITEKGKAYIHHQRKEYLRWAIPVVISLIALLVSCAALYYSVYAANNRIANTIAISATSITIAHQ